MRAQMPGKTFPIDSGAILALPVSADTWGTSQAKARPYRPWLPVGRGNPLTEREREVVLGASRGLESRQIAAYLGIEYATVKTYKQHVLQKLNVYTMTGAVSLCLRRGWIS